MVTTMVLAVLLPALITGILLLAFSRLAGEERGPGLGCAIGLALGFAAGQVVLVGWPGWFPVDATYRLLHLALAAGAVGVAAVVGKPRPAPEWILRGVLAVLLLGLLLRSVMEHRWEGSEDVVWLAGLFVAVVLFGSVLEHLAQATRGAALPLLLILLASAGSVALVLARSAFLGQLAGSLAAALGAVGTVALLRPATSLSRGGVPVVSTVLLGLWMCGYFFASLPAASALLLWLAPAAAALGGAGPLGRRPAWQVLALRIVFLLVPAGLAVYFAYAASSGSSAADYGY